MRRPARVRSSHCFTSRARTLQGTLKAASEAWHAVIDVDAAPVQEDGKLGAPGRVGSPLSGIQLS